VPAGLTPAVSHPNRGAAGHALNAGGRAASCAAIRYSRGRRSSTARPRHPSPVPLCRGSAPRLLPGPCPQSCPQSCPNGAARAWRPCPFAGRPCRRARTFRAGHGRAATLVDGMLSSRCARRWQVRFVDAPILTRRVRRVLDRVCRRGGPCVAQGPRGTERGRDWAVCRDLRRCVGTDAVGRVVAGARTTTMTITAAAAACCTGPRCAPTAATSGREHAAGHGARR
jgi:hypothetical protein